MSLRSIVDFKRSPPSDYKSVGKAHPDKPIAMGADGAAELDVFFNWKGKMSKKTETKEVKSGAMPDTIQ